jgi:hypothetical protein
MTCLCLLVLGGCASERPTTRWQPGMKAWFTNDSLHVDADRRKTWTREDEEQLLRQLGHADVVAVGSIHSLQQASHYGAARQLSLAFRPAEVLHGSLEGDLDRDRLLVVHVAPRGEAIRAARALPTRPGQSRYLLVLKRRPLPGGGHQLRWAIYQPSTTLLAHVRSLFARLQKDHVVASS